jgi:purine nucleosidase
MKYPEIPISMLLKRLEPKTGTIRMVLDTDTFNEIDDQFAVAYALKSKDRLNVEAFYAAPFFNELSSSPKDGMEKSYAELITIFERFQMSPEGKVFRGSTTYLQADNEPVLSEAAEDLVERAMASPVDDPLYVVGIGAITNVASAILMEPKIIEKIVVVWLGGHAFHWPDTKEFNLYQDVPAARIIFDSGVPLVLVPCMGVASHLSTTLSEMETFVKGKGAIGDYLYETFLQCSNDHYGYSRVIWDISTIAYLLNESWVPTELVHSPVLSNKGRWSSDRRRHFIRSAYYVNRDAVFKDLFRKLERITIDKKTTE